VSRRPVAVGRTPYARGVSQQSLFPDDVVVARTVGRGSAPQLLPGRSGSSEADHRSGRPRGDVAAAGPPPAATPDPTRPAEPEVEVRRSRRRRRTVSAYRDGDRIVVLVPARLTRREEADLVAEMIARLAAREARLRPSDAELMERAQRLSARHLDGRARPASVAWVGNQGRRWGSCTVEDATIRLSRRLQGMPSWVVDYVLLHELAHLIEPGHGPRFWQLLADYPHLERARGFLEGVTAAYDEGVGAPDGSGARPTADPSTRSTA
jgi:predicted metal-dependent hydrolase